MSAWIPQALGNRDARRILAVFRDEAEFLRYWADKVKTEDAPGVEIHPRHVQAGDTIDLFITGWNRDVVESVGFVPDTADVPDYHRVGTYYFKTAHGSIACRVNGLEVAGPPLYVFNK